MICLDTSLTRFKGFLYFFPLKSIQFGGTILRKKNITKASGYIQLLLTAYGLFEVVRRFIGYQENPIFQTMILISLFALIGNSIGWHLLQKSKDREARIRASMNFTSNDVFANVGVIIAGILVCLTDSEFLDLIVGLIIFAVVGRGTFRTLQIAKSQLIGFSIVTF